MDRVAFLIEQYPGPVRLPVSRGRVGFLLGFGIFLFGAAAYNIVQPNGIAGWLAVVFCVLCAIGLLTAFLRRKLDGPDHTDSLILDEDGFSIGEGRNSRRFKWAEVGNFAVVPDELVLFRNRVGFDPANTVLDETNGFQSRTFRLPESYELTNDGCVRLLSSWQERALRSATG